MRSALSDALPLLIEQGLVEPSAIVAGDLTLADASGRNRNLRIERRHGPGYLVKRADPAAGRELLSREARFLRFCETEPRASEVAAFVPKLRVYTRQPLLLAFELLRDARPLRASPVDRLDDAAGVLGRHLATLHRAFAPERLARDPGLHWLSREPPIALDLHRPVPAMLSRLSPARRRFFRIVQNEGVLRSRLERLRRSWRAEHVIHGDVRSSNVLVGELDGQPRVHLVDWETVQLGDPAWDTAGALQEILLLWVRGMSSAKGLTAAERIATAALQLERLRPAARELWREDGASSGLAAERLRDRLLRSVAFSGAMLVQTAYEWSRARNRMTVRATLLMQLADRLLANPEQGIELYGVAE